MDMGDQFDEWDKFFAEYEKKKTINGAMQSYRYHRNKEKAEAKDPRTAGKSPGGLGLTSHHAKLNAEGYVPPPVVEVPFKYVGKKVRPLKDARCKLTDQQVMFCRKNVGRLGITELSRRYNVSYQSMRNAVLGYSYKRLNIEPPVPEE
jgi:hypothetical protein